MAISHVCMSCGLDLARVRARFEPRYALPIVVCPDCGWAAVRRRRSPWRPVLRLQVSLVTLAVQLGLLTVGLVGLGVVSIELGDVLARGGFGSLPRDEVVLRLGLCVAFAVALGAWLTAGLGHCRRVITWPVFTGLGLALVTAVSLVDRTPQRLPQRYAMLALTMAVATAGVPVGMLLRGAGREIERAVRRRHRRRLRPRSMER